MLGASRESLAGLSDRLDEVRSDASFASVAGDLYAVADLLEREKGLRIALSDSGTPVLAREATVRELLQGRISAPALALVAAAASARWSADRDLVDALERLAAQAAFTSAEADGTLDATEEEIFRFGRAVDASPELQMALTDPGLESSAKSAIVGDLLQGRATAATRQVLEYAAGHLRGRRVDAVVDDLADLAATQRNRVVAEVRVARPMSDEQQQRLGAVLSQLKGRTVRLNVAVDPDILGGVYVRVDDEVIDGTVATRMEQARRAVLG